ncbi:hypothetical protein EB796_024934 [Bugula neritina]|uniref:Uncharacterized protein n=1 Tax=Bugula neritina TaxID=10212 RepID=A0A7J7ITN3_BUGNE|nr:hypothetical protein EB796_024934 [Bugula neritina]
MAGYYLCFCYLRTNGDGELYTYNVLTLTYISCTGIILTHTYTDLHSSRNTYLYSLVYSSVIIAVYSKLTLTYIRSSGIKPPHLH